MRLVLLHPAVASRDCQHCLKWNYDEKRGVPHTRNGKPDGKPVKRNHASPPMCQTPEGCPKGTPENQKTLSEKNADAYMHYRECRAVGRFPDDPIVRRNARVIRSIEDEAERRDEVEFRNLLLTLAVARG